MVLWWRIQWSSILFIYIINFFLPLQTDFSLCDVIPNLVSIEENATLIAIPKASEIKQAVFSLNPNSALLVRMDILVYSTKNVGILLVGMLFFVFRLSSKKVGCHLI